MRRFARFSGGNKTISIRYVLVYGYSLAVYLFDDFRRLYLVAETRYHVHKILTILFVAFFRCAILVAVIKRTADFGTTQAEVSVWNVTVFRRTRRIWII